MDFINMSLLVMIFCNQYNFGNFHSDFNFENKFLL